MRGRPKIWAIFVLTVAIAIGLVVSWHPLEAGFKRLVYRPQVRTYYVSAETGTWNYAPGKHPIPAPFSLQSRYTKTRYIQYTDASFRTQIFQPAWMGILGPIIRGVPGDTIKVVFKNNAAQPYDLQPQGLTAVGNAGGPVLPGRTRVYLWRVPAAAGPGPGQGSSRVWLYSSQVRPSDINTGLIGPIIITTAAHALGNAAPDDVNQEFVTLLMMFDESQPGMSGSAFAGSQKYAINGLTFNKLGDLDVQKGESVRWDVLSLGPASDVPVPDWRGNLVTERANTEVTVGRYMADLMTADEQAGILGAWAFQSHDTFSELAGMSALFTVIPPGSWVVEGYKQFHFWFWLFYEVVLLLAWSRAQRGHRDYTVALAILTVVPVAVFVVISENEWREWLSYALMLAGIAAVLFSKRWWKRIP